MKIERKDEIRKRARIIVSSDDIDWQEWYRQDVPELRAELAAAEQRAAEADKALEEQYGELFATKEQLGEAELLLAECKGHLAEVTKKQWAYDTGKGKVFCPWCGTETFPHSTMYTPHIDCPRQGAAKWLIEHGG